MNCLKDGHTYTHCKEAMMCPYCSGAHPADSCELKGKMTSNCTTCARVKKTKDSNLDLRTLFSTTPKDLSHSPLDPTCPARVAEKLAKAAEALSKSTTHALAPALAGTRPSTQPQPQPRLAPAPALPAATADTLEEDTAMVVSS